MSFISSLDATAYPRRAPASERDFENVPTTIRFGYLRISGTEDSAPKSTYASSITTTFCLFDERILSILSEESASPVGALGLAMNIVPFAFL